ncbi:ATP-grasp domain-containing protein [Actinokineospora globicatena]|uniref:ATP-grasp domain-containing protein n=1 Tax=Actinokineospora globicatena TaxID=103729 RepID=UPI0020A25137|nr:ATP-grasp domain-containing protein [Actinokineospora globicatena]MCP2303823.1 ATP-grasp domain-containing protein [Actinokineospora globicatena]GLW79024.1 hypothetical protein Aglo01_35060 [Actinokineospora globicatena]GLW86565.1 hypothetical protein Aglo02_42040 [Actinokineospora globicatena]
MRKIAFLRSIEIQQTVPYLEELGVALRERGLVGKLFYTDGECAPGEFPGEVEKMPAGVSVAETLRRIREWGTDGVISLSIPDENALRDALVCERLAAEGIPTVMHSAAATGLMANKWETKLLVGAHGLDTPEGVLVDGDLLNSRTLPVPAYRDYLVERAGELGYPLLSKPLWDCLGNGIRFLADQGDLDGYLDEPYDGNVVLERCVAGELCSVEVVGAAGDYVVQPLLWKGPTGGAPTFAFTTVRYTAPRAEADERFAPVAERLKRLCAALEVTGSVEVEMIYVDGRYEVIEINPRVSGSTSLSIAASGLNTYVAMLDILFGEWGQRHDATSGSAKRIALQFPTTPLDDAADADIRATLAVVRSSSFTIDGTRYANTVITCEYSDVDTLGAHLDELSRRHGFLIPEVRAAVDDVLAGVRAAIDPALAQG